jgi:hypothetical protein
MAALRPACTGGSGGGISCAGAPASAAGVAVKVAISLGCCRGAIMASVPIYEPTQDNPSYFGPPCTMIQVNVIMTS